MSGSTGGQFGSGLQSAGSQSQQARRYVKSPARCNGPGRHSCRKFPATRSWFAVRGGAGSPGLSITSGGWERPGSCSCGFDATTGANSSAARNENGSHGCSCTATTAGGWVGTRTRPMEAGSDSRFGNEVWSGAARSGTSASHATHPRRTSKPGRVSRGSADWRERVQRVLCGLSPKKGSCPLHEVARPTTGWPWLDRHHAQDRRSRFHG